MDNVSQGITGNANTEIERKSCPYRRKMKRKKSVVSPFVAGIVDFLHSSNLPERRNEYPKTSVEKEHDGKGFFGGLPHWPCLVKFVYLSRRSFSPFELSSATSDSAWRSRRFSLRCANGVSTRRIFSVNASAKKYV